MNQDLPFPDGDPGLDHLFRTVTSGPTRAELAGQDAALAMFRANITPAPAPAAGRRFGFAFRRGLGLAAATAVALAGGVTAAAYADALPSPVQHVVHDVFNFAGVPDQHHHRAAAASRHRGHHPGGGRAGHSGAVPSPQPSGSPAPARSRGAGASPATSHSPAASHSPSAAPSPSPSPSSSPSLAGPATLTASAGSAQISAGGQVVIDGQLTRSGRGVGGVTITLHEHLAGTPGWHNAGIGQTNADGNVVVPVSALISDAAFRLTAGGGVHSLAVHVIVIPVVTITLKPGPAGLRDLLRVSTQYARPLNRVELQVDKAGVWTSLRGKRLNAARATHFYLSGSRLKGDLVRVVLLATLRHGEAVSNEVTVPSPS